jgi:hypothetical protein
LTLSYQLGRIIWFRTICFIWSLTNNRISKLSIRTCKLIPAKKHLGSGTFKLCGLSFDILNHLFVFAFQVTLF